ncbi:Uncharacterised protein [Raoultella planticola]|uniref:Uncharacterized protein n=1 Tax=Raoultella planticola TaxID=575 RepID=A0A485DBU7_RAOPL|nr:Uncharacterised protein [Raoultella planticola]
MPICSHRQRQFGESGQRIATAAHRRGAGVGGKTLQRDVEPALAHCRVDEADINPFFFQNRPLFDMDLITGMNRECGRRTIAAVADGLQRRADADAVAIFAGQRESFAELPGPHADASIAGAKRAPSSLVQLTSTISRSVSMPRSFSVRSASSPASTP